MQIDDLTLEVRDRDLQRVGQITPAFLSLEARGRWCDVGEWTLTLPGDHPLIPALAEPGSGIILTGPAGRGSFGETLYETMLSGPTTIPKRVRDRENPDGTYTFTGATDEILLLGALAFPSPEVGDPGAQTAANDTRTGLTEDLLRAFVDANVGASAPSTRRTGLRGALTLSGASLGRGVPQVKSPRFQRLLEVLQEIVTYDPDLGFRVVQVGDALEFQVLTAGDRRSLVRFDIENGTVTSEEIAQSGPIVTRAIVAGQGEGVNRLIISRTDAEATAAESDWGIVWEEFVDQRDTNAVEELEQSGDERLLEGRGGTAVKMIPAEDATMLYGLDWRLGDQVTPVISGVETASRVMEYVLRAGPNGVTLGAGLGDVSGFTVADAESSKVQSLDSRVSNLERAASGADVVNPTGVVLEFAGATAPAGWLLCDGAVVNRADYPALFDVIGTVYNTGGETGAQFRLPNRAGRVGVGRDAAQSEFDTLGETGGAKTHTLTEAQIPSHTHGAGANADGFMAHRTNTSGGYSTVLFTGTPGDVVNYRQPANTGGGQAHNNLQPYIVVNFIIKT